MRLCLLVLYCIRRPILATAGKVKSNMRTYYYAEISGCQGGGYSVSEERLKINKQFNL